jgi:butyrate kinase
MVAYLGTHDMRIVEEQVRDNNEKARLVYEAMAYQVCKEIGALATVLQGDVDAIALTGGMARSKQFVKRIKERTEFIAPVYAFPGEREMRALALGALRVLNNEEKAREYHFE